MKDYILESEEWDNRVAFFIDYKSAYDNVRWNQLKMIVIER